MGVMECSRKGCKNILSEYYSPLLGHLCEGCYKEGVRQLLSPEDFLKTTKLKSIIHNQSFILEYKRINEEF